MFADVFDSPVSLPERGACYVPPFQKRIRLEGFLHSLNDFSGIRQQRQRLQPWQPDYSVEPRITSVPLRWRQRLRSRLACRSGLLSDNIMFAFTSPS